MNTPDPADLYVYTAVITRVIDGDTVRADTDLGFGVWLRDRPYRLAGCNARELSAPGGPEARDALALLLPPGTRVTARSVRVDKYGDRYDAQITLPSGLDLVTVLAAGQWVALWDGRGTAPVPPWPRPFSSAAPPVPPSACTTADAEPGRPGQAPSRG